MNNKTRKEIRAAISSLESMQEEIDSVKDADLSAETVADVRTMLDGVEASLLPLPDIQAEIGQWRDDEQDKLDNMPDNLRDSSRYSDLEGVVDNLDSAFDSLTVSTENDSLGDITDGIGDCIDSLNYAIE